MILCNIKYIYIQRTPVINREVTSSIIKILFNMSNIGLMHTVLLNLTWILYLDTLVKE